MRDRWIGVQCTARGQGMAYPPVDCGTGGVRIMTLSLNRRGLWVVESLLAHAEERRVAVHAIEGGGRFIDCGIEARGGLLAGVELARVCLGDLATVSFVPGEGGGRSIPM